MPQDAFTGLIDLASARVGGRALAASDDFFAPKANLLKPEPPVFIPGKFTSRGKWMDGWESRRRRSPGHDWALVRLGLPGVVRGVVVDTRHFNGNQPETVSLEFLEARPAAGPAELARAAWTPLVPASPVRPDGPNLFAVESSRRWTHVRLNIFPDGGVARLRVHGEVLPDWERLARSGRPVDLAAVENGGFVLAASDEHFGRKENLIMPGRAPNMGDGWETRRRRGPGHDWVLLRLGRAGTVERLEVDTNHFKGNYPDACWVDGLHAPGASADALRRLAWEVVLPSAKLRPHKRHLFQGRELRGRRPYTHLRLSIAPDGGVSRFRVHGRPV